MFKQYVLPWIVFIFYRTLSWTWRIRVIESPEFKDRIENKKPMIISHFHGDELALLHTVGTYKFCTMTSTSKDGSLIDFVIRMLGGKTSRGSSTRGGVQALKGLIGLVRKGHPATIAVDGPKGPIYKVKPGVFEISRLAKAEIFTFACIAPNSKIFEKAWNKTYLPKPFSRVDISIQPAMKTIDKTMDARDPKLAEELEKKLFDSRSHLGKLIADA